jgi:ketosteroid isomerase-like protein
MNMGRLLTGAILLSGCMASGMAADRADLEKTFEDVLQRIRQKDADGLVAHFHPEAVIFLRNRFFPLDFEEMGKAAFDDLVKSFLSEVVDADLRPMDVSYRVVNGVGIVWGLARFHVEPKEGVGSSFQSRMSIIFAEDEGTWKIVHWHTSAIPSGLERTVTP